MFNSFFGEINRFRRLGGCARCLELNHFGSNCSSPPRCAVCFKSGHKFIFCETRSRPRVFWRPKVRENQPSLAAQASGIEYQETGSYRVSPPNSRTPENSNLCPVSPALESVPLYCNPPSQEALPEAEMANFAVDPAPFVLEGLEIEDWARPARGRIVINGNPPHRHVEYASISLFPPLAESAP
jgi:hypothetical protein